MGLFFPLPKGHHWFQRPVGVERRTAMTEQPQETPQKEAKKVSAH